MANKNFKVKNNVQISDITSASFLTTDSNGVVASGVTLGISSGGTGQTTADNAINALLPLQTSNDNKFLQTSGISTQWTKVYNQVIKNAGTTVNPRGTINFVGAVFADDSQNDITTVDLSDKASLSSANTFTVGPQQINTGDSTNSGLIIKGSVGQNSGAALTQWQSSTSSLLAQISGTGRIYSSVSITAGSNSTTLGTLTVVNTSATTLGLVIRGAASQSANLQEWQTSAGTIIGRIASNGDFQVGSINLGRASVTSDNASKVGLGVRGASSQTADLQQWLNSSGTVLSKVDASGIIYSPTAASGTNTTQVATTEFVQTAVNNLIDSSPSTLNTLNEIAAALNDDPNFYSTITSLTTALSSQDTYSLMGVF